MTVAEFLNKEEENLILQAIQQAELATSGEIRVHIESSSKQPALTRAATVFKKLNMHKTEARNGVLFYVAIKDKSFAIIGDKGINQLVPNDFWDSTKEVVLAAFKNGEYALGLIKGIEEAGVQLKEHFPYQTNDTNELPNEISFGD